MNDNARLKLAIIGVCLTSAMGGIIYSEFNLAMASIKSALNVSLVDLQWIINAYGIVICGVLVLFGRLGDVIGRKKLFLIGLMILALAMLGTGLAQHLGLIIACQVLNAIASAIIMPVSQALITNLYPAERRSKAIGIWAGSTGIALGLGPFYAGLVIHFISWRWVFLLNVPVILISSLLVFYFCPDSKSDEAKPRLDWLGAGILMLAMASLVTAIVQMDIWSLSTTLSLLAVSVLLFVTLYIVEGRVAQPIIREDLFKNRSFVFASLCNCCLLFFIWAAFFLMPLYFQTVLGYSPLDAGMVMALVTIPLVVFSFFSERTYNRFGAQRLIRVGFLCLLLSAIIQYFFNVHINTLWIIVAALAFGCAWGLIWNPSATKAISTLPQAHAGVASGTFVTFQEVGGSAGLAITGSVVRAYPMLHIGYARGMLVLVSISVIGLLISFKIRNQK